MAADRENPRTAVLHDWLRRRGYDPAGLVALAGDAGARRYFRLPTGTGSRVVMDAPGQAGECHAYLRVGRLLSAAGLHVPQVEVADPELGVMVLEDLGDRDYLNALQRGVDAGLMEDALAALVRWQAATRPGVLPAYDDARLRAELELFPAWYVRRHLGVQPDAAWLAVWRSAREALIEAALAQPRVWVHRDYMVRNLLVADPNPGIIDFQDALEGPVTYDLVSLLRDAFIGFPAQAEREWCARYEAMAREAGVALPDDLPRALDWMGAQRHLKVLGVFARLWHRDGKPRYLRDAPRFMGYLSRELAAYPALAGLRGLLAALPAPEVPSCRP